MNKFLFLITHALELNHNRTPSISVQVWFVEQNKPAYIGKRAKKQIADHGEIRQSHKPCNAKESFMLHAEGSYPFEKVVLTFLNYTVNIIL